MRQEAAAKLGNTQIDGAHLGCEHNAVAFPVAKAFLAALVAMGTARQRPPADQRLQAMAHQLDCGTMVRGNVRLVKFVFKPGARHCQPFSTPSTDPGA